MGMVAVFNISTVRGVVSNSHRDSEAKLHRALSVFYAVCAWKLGVDCIVVKVDGLKGLLGVNGIRDVRMDWLFEDVNSLFPFCKRGGGGYCVYLSRRELPRVDDFVYWHEGHGDVIRRLGEDGVLAGFVETPSEEDLFGLMGVLVSGVVDIESISSSL